MASPAAAAEAGAGGGGLEEIVFIVEVPQAQGLPKPEKTVAKLAGFAFAAPATSQPAAEESSEPSGWLFSPGVGGSEEEEKEPEPAFRLSRPCRTPDERRRLLDSVCSPLEVVLTRSEEPFLCLGSATLEAQDLIHGSDVVEAEVELRWSEELLAELKAEFEEAAAAEKAAAEAEAGGEEAAEGAEGAEGSASPATPPPVFQAPPAGKIHLRVSTAGPIGRVLCPEDLHDWSVLSVQVDGCYGLPEGLAQLPEDVGYSLRLLGCSFDGGHLVTPPAPETPEPAEGEAEAQAAGGEVPEGEAGGEDADKTRAPSVLQFDVDVGQEEFVEGLLRAGFLSAAALGPAIFEYLAKARTGLGGKIGREEFMRLDEMSVPAEPEGLLALHEKLIEKHGTLDEAFGALDEAQSGSLSREAFTAALEALGYSVEDPAEAEALFSALDAGQDEALSREGFKTLGLYKRMAELRTAEKTKGWLLACTGSVESLVKQVDEAKTGTVSLEAWKAALERLGYPSAEDAELVFKLLDGAKEESIPSAAFEVLGRLDAEAIARALPELEEFLAGPCDGDPVAAIRTLLGDASGETVSASAFEGGCKRLGYGLAPDVSVLFSLLDAASEGVLAWTEVAALQCYNEVSRRRELASCKTFFQGTFGSVGDAFQKMFDDRVDFYQEAEETKPRIEWSNKVVSGYRGREWLQQLLNTLRDERGRNCASGESPADGGSWLYFFPKPAGEEEAVADFKDMAEGAEKTAARACRWHHALGFVDLRRLTAPGPGPQVEFRAFLSQVAEQPADANAAGDLPPATFGASQTYIKGVIRLDRPLVRLCPRDIQPLPEPGGKPFIPPPPPKKAPPSCIEEFEFDARRVVGKLAVHFARMCKENGLEEGQVGGPGGRQAPHVLLGRQGVTAPMFFQWLMELDDGQVYKELSQDLRPAIVKMVRTEAKDGPSCGLCGNEDDAKYSGIRDMILKHLFKALNQDVRLYSRKRDARLWRSPLMKDDADALDPNFGKPVDLAAQQREQDATLRRLAFEYELVGDIARAKTLFKERLELAANVESGDAWFGFARFLMRCGQNQPEALNSVRYAVSLRPAEAGPSLEEAAFLTGVLLNYARPCTLGQMEPPQDLRFDAAVSILMGYADRHPAEPEPLYLLFAAFAQEASRMQEVDATRRACGFEVKSEAAGAFRAEAMKYLRLARACPGAFAGTLGKPEFPELQSLVRREGLARGLAHEAPVERPGTPEAWAPAPRPPFAEFTEAHRVTDADDATALRCVDLMLRLGTPCLVTYLLETLPQDEYEFISRETMNSDRCKLQLVKAAMLDADWGRAEGLIEGLLARCRCNREAHVLLGECRYRRAREAGGAPELMASALEAFQWSLGFLPEPEGEAPPPEVRAPVEDPVLHLRVASIHYGRAAASGFADVGAMGKAEEHYAKALQIAPMAEAWKNAGICAYRRARLQQTTEDRVPHLKRARKCLVEANLLDKGRPQVNAWLAICSVELGKSQVAKQAIRTVLRFQEQLDMPAGLELAEVLLHFSDEKKAAPGERPLLVQEGRYATEAIALSRVALERLPKTPGGGEGLDAGRARYVLAQSLALTGELEAALAEFCKALPCLAGDAERQRVAVSDARACSARLPHEPRWALMVEDAVAKATASSEQPPQEA